MMREAKYKSGTPHYFGNSDGGREEIEGSRREGWGGGREREERGKREKD